jgi:hypothetical protein
LLLARQKKQGGQFKQCSEDLYKSKLWPYAKRTAIPSNDTRESLEKTCSQKEKVSPPNYPNPAGSVL